MSRVFAETEILVDALNGDETLVARGVSELLPGEQIALQRALDLVGKHIPARCPGCREPIDFRQPYVPGVNGSWHPSCAES